MNDDITTRLRRDCMSLIADEAADEIERLRKERDEARRFACQNTIHPLRMPIGMTPKEYAEVLGWDCFKEDGK